MEKNWRGWLVVGLLWTTTLYALAEELSLTTYYPSPKGAYQTLSSTDSSRFATYAGNVGIGTISPAATTKLEVKGAGNTSGSAGLHVTNSDGTSGLFVRDDGNVGIGTVSPFSILDVSKATTGTTLGYGSNLSLVNTQGVDTANLRSEIDFRFSNGISNSNSYLGVANQTAGDADLIFAPATRGNGTERMRITAEGNVGIGTSAPVTPLQVGTGASLSVGQGWNKIVAAAPSGLAGLSAVVGGAATFVSNNGTIGGIANYNYDNNTTYQMNFGASNYVFTNPATDFQMASIDGSGNAVFPGLTAVNLAGGGATPRRVCADNNGKLVAC